MKNKKSIDRIFQEKFKDFEASPNEKVWKNIAAELQRKKKRGAVIPLWYKIAGVAALIAVIFTIGGLFFTPPDEPQVVDTKKEQQPNANHEPSKKGADSSTDLTPVESAVVTSTEEKTNNRSEEKSSTESLPAENSNQNNSTNSSEEYIQKKSVEKNSRFAANTSKNTKSSAKSNSRNTPKIASEEEKEKHEKLSTESNNNNQNKLASQDVQEKNSEKNTSEKVATETKPDINELVISENPENTAEEKTEEEAKNELLAELNENEDKNNTVAEEYKLSKWLIRPNVSPIYYNSLSGGSTIDPQFENNSAESEVTMAYGVNVAYTVSKKLKIRSGVGQVSMSYNTNDISFAPSPRAQRLAGVKSSPATTNIQVSNKPATVSTFSEVSSDNVDIDPATNGVLNQALGFIEVPVEVEYALVDKRFGVNVIGGASTLFLNENNITIDSPSGITTLGKANNLNSISFSTNIGLGFDYGITKKIDLSLEPTFKYQLNTFSKNTNGFRPYYFGVYTGLSFKF